MNTPIEQLTADGYDLQFGTNVIGHYVFTKRLLPLLFAGAKSSPDRIARIVNISSSAHMFTDTIEFDAIKDGPKRRKLGSSKMYMQSKFVIFSCVLGRLLLWLTAVWHVLVKKN
jgi:retinol dehydrogenase 12